jgi:hypothetical protein
MINKTKKTLLILFGELRTFEYVVPFLNKLNEVDVIISTWSNSHYDTGSFNVTEPLITKILPNIKQCHITDSAKINVNHKSHSWRMYWHWKTAINNIENSDEYENVILHRCDLISNWDTILDLEIKDDTLYLNLGEGGVDEVSYIDSHSGIWVDDYYFFGKFNVMKKFINSFNKENYPVPHFPIWDVLSENNINFKDFKLETYLIKYYHINWLKDLIKKNKLSIDSSFYDMWVNLQTNEYEKDYIIFR